MTADPGPVDPALALLQRWQEADDRDALDELLRLEVATLAARLRKRAGAQLRPSQSASDLAQEAVARLLACAEPPTFDQPAQLRAYLWKAAWRLLLNRIERAGRRVVPLADHAPQELAAPGSSRDAAAGALARERSLAVQLAVQLLPREDGEILTLVYFDELPIAAAAERLGLTRGAADMRLTRARRRLAQKLVDWSDVIA